MFKNIEKSEIRALMSYFKNANIKMRQLNSDTNKPKIIPQHVVIAARKEKSPTSCPKTTQSKKL